MDAVARRLIWQPGDLTVPNNIARRLIWQPGDLTVPNNVGRSTRLPSPRVKPSPLRNRSKSVSGVSYAKKSAEKRQSAPAVATGSSQGHKSTAPGTAQPIVEKVAEQKAQGYPARFRDPPLTPQVKSIFSYFVKEYKEGRDKRGRRYCTDNGKRVTCRGGPQKPAPKPSTAQPDKETGRRQTAEEKESGKRRKAEEKASEKQRKQQQKEGEKKQKEEARATAKQQKAEAKVTAKKQKEEAKQAAKEQADKAAKEAVSKALDAAREISKDPSKATAQQVKIVGDALLTLKLDELKKLKTELGIKKGSTKVAIVEGIKKQALDNAAKGKVPGQEKKPVVKFPADDAVRSFSQDIALRLNHTADGLTAESKASFTAYTDHHYEPINFALRTNRQDDLDDQQLKVVEDMDAALKATKPLPTPELVYRGITLSEKRAKAFEGMLQEAMGKADKTLSMGGQFISTSVDPRMMSEFGSPRPGNESFKFEISASKGIYTGGFSKHADEKEMVLPRDAKFRVVGVKEITVQNNNRTMKHKVYQLEQV